MDEFNVVPEVLGSEHDVHSLRDEPSNGDTIEYYFQPLQLTQQKVHWLWDRFSQFPQAWDDYTAGNFQAFVSMLSDRYSVFIEVCSDREGKNPVGLLTVTKIIPNHMAEVHCVFWDRSFRNREHVCRTMLTQIFKQFNLKRVATFIPEINKPACKFAKRLGLRHEGTLRRAALYQGQFIDCLVFGILKEELNVESV